jgi:hypothetical protein
MDKDKTGVILHSKEYGMRWRCFRCPSPREFRLQSYARKLVKADKVAFRLEHVASTEMTSSEFVVSVLVTAHSHYARGNHKKAIRNVR